MSENLGNIEYHKGWVLERNPEPDKLHNKFAWAEKHGVSISIGPNDIGESTQKSEKGRLSEMFDDDFDQDSSIETIHDVRELFKNELFHNSDAYSKAMKKAMSICITRLREAEKPDYTGLTSLIEYLENFITKMSTLNESVETDKVKAAIEQEAMEARKAAKTFTEEKKLDDAKKIGRKIRGLKNIRRDAYYNCRYLKWHVKMASEFYIDILRLGDNAKYFSDYVRNLDN